MNEETLAKLLAYGNVHFGILAVLGGAIKGSDGSAKEGCTVGVGSCARPSD